MTTDQTPQPAVHASGPHAGQPVTAGKFADQEAADRARRAEWAAGLRWFDRRNRNVENWVSASLLADRIEDGELSPWAGQPVEPPAAEQQPHVHVGITAYGDLPAGLADQLAAELAVVARRLVPDGAGWRAGAVECHCDQPAAQPLTEPTRLEREVAVACGLPVAESVERLATPSPADEAGTRLCEATVHDREGEPEPCGRERPCPDHPPGMPGGCTRRWGDWDDLPSSVACPDCGWGRPAHPTAVVGAEPARDTPAATTPTDGLDLDAIQARAAAATPEPWHATGRDDSPGDEGWWVNGGGVPGSASERAVAACPTYSRHAAQDMEFIAAARSDVPALVAEVRRLRSAVAVRDDWQQYGSRIWDPAVIQGLLDNLDGLDSPDRRPEDRCRSATADHLRALLARLAELERSTPAPGVAGGSPAILGRARKLIRERLAADPDIGHQHAFADLLADVAARAVAPLLPSPSAGEQRGRVVEEARELVAAWRRGDHTVDGLAIAAAVDALDGDHPAEPALSPSRVLTQDQVDEIVGDERPRLAEPAPEPDSGTGWDRVPGAVRAAWLAELERLNSALTNTKATMGERIAGRERDLRDVMAERDAARAELDGVRAELERMAGDLADRDATVALRTDQLRGAHREAGRLGHEIDRLRAELEQWRTRAELAESRLDGQAWADLTAEVERQRQRADTATGKVLEEHLAYQQMLDRAEAAKAEVERLRAELATARRLVKETAQDRDDAQDKVEDFPDRLATARRDAFADGMQHAIGLPAADDALADHVLDWIEGVIGDIRAGRSPVPDYRGAGPGSPEPAQGGSEGADA